MDKIVNVTFRHGEVKQYLEETTLLEISHDYDKVFNYPVLAARVDNELTELGEQVFKNCNVDFYDRSSLIGNSIYGRSLQFILALAVKRVLGKESDVVIQHSIDNGFYCELANTKADKNTVNAIEKEMKEIVKDDLIFNKVSVTRIDALNYFKKRNQTDKIKVLKYVSNSYVSLYRLDDIYDYYYGELAYSTGVIDSFKLTYINEEGFVTSYPTISNPECTLDYNHHELLFNKFLNYTKWGRAGYISQAADLNNRITHGDHGRIIRIAEAYSNMQLMHTAEEIWHNQDKIKVILIAGPTSSGKTTTSKKLENFLQAFAIPTYQISVDNYFLDRSKTPKKKDGTFDFESLKAIDVNQFNKDLTKLLSGKEVIMPIYNFVEGKREFSKKPLKIVKGGIIIIEGLHALNDDLTPAIDRKDKYKIFVTPLTQLNIDNHNRIHTADTRKLRRIVRDNQYRGKGASETLKMWKEIRDSEQKYIYPFQNDVNMIINSALLYELGVLKTFAEPLLFSVDESDENYPEAIRLINLLRNFLPIPTDEIPQDSVLREFIGNSCFK